MLRISGSRLHVLGLGAEASILGLGRSWRAGGVGCSVTRDMKLRVRGFGELWELDVGDSRNEA